MCLNGWLGLEAQDPDTSEAQGRSQVRDSEDGLEVLAVCRDDDGVLRLPPDVGPYSGRAIPVGVDWSPADEGLARAMAACTLRLPQSMCHPGATDRVIGSLERQVDHSGWQASHWLRGQLSVAFDRHGVATIAAFQLQYDQERGIACPST
ncbi:MAG: hypothetical protein IPL43_11255 [Micropruina sp.]|nr:hypothetical protein [Micropruina sp.]